MIDALSADPQVPFLASSWIAVHQTTLMALVKSALVQVIVCKFEGSWFSMRRVTKVDSEPQRHSRTYWRASKPACQWGTGLVEYHLKQL